MTRRARIAVVLAAGLVVGSGAAALVDRGESRGQVRATTTTLSPVRLAPAFPAPSLGGRQRVITPGSVVSLPPVHDPSGDPPWTVRAWSGEIRTPSRRPGHPPFRLPQHCAELGRELDGRFGWVYPDRRFRPSAPGDFDYGAVCGVRRGHPPDIRATIALSFTPLGEPRMRAGIVWGLVPRGVREVRITGVAGGERTVRPDAAGMFLLVTEPGALRSTRAVPSRPRGGIVRVRLAGPLDGGALGPRVLAGSERIETTAPNPLGGPAWALVAGRTRAGHWCVLGQAQTIGDRYGAIETTYGTFDTVQLGRHCHTQPPPPTRQNPVTIGIGYSSTQSPQRDVLVRRARIERRIPTGMQVFSAVCDDSVERVTIRTPQDIRTLVPSPRAHAILALYAGTPVAGDTVITAHLRDGTTRRQRLPGLF